ncbi:MAG: thermonuclease family protein [Gammaproteobacteria bacterium]
MYDGDTLVLSDRRKVRLIGINTPELPRDGSPGQPYSQEARDALTALLETDDELGLRFDEERVDRYGRLLAHLYRVDGSSIQAWLLTRGYAVAIAVPPNLRNQDCYRRAEEQASRAGLGVWVLPYYQPLAATGLKAAAPEAGFRFVRGKVARAGAGAGAVWLNLEGGLALRIARPDLRYFPDFRPRDLVGRTVIARGWLNTGGAAPLMQIRHPASLQVVEDDG